MTLRDNALDHTSHQVSRRVVLRMLLSSLGAFPLSGFLTPAISKDARAAIYCHFISAFAWSSDSSKLAIVDRVGPKIVERKSLSIVQEYDIPKPEMDPILKGFRGEFENPFWLHIDWSHNGSTIAAAQIAATYILSPTSSKPLCVIKYAPENPPKYHPPVGYGFTGIALSPDGGQIAISTESGVSVFRCDNGQQSYEYRHFKHKSCNPRWSPDGRYIAAADGVHSQSFPSEIHVWNAQSGACVAKFASAWQANPELDWLPDNQLLAVAGESGISFYDLEKGTGTPVCDLRFKDSMLFSWSSKSKVAAVYDSCKHPGIVELRDLLSDRVTKQIRLGELRNVMQRGTCSLKWSPDGSELAMLHFGGPLAFWKF